MLISIGLKFKFTASQRNENLNNVLSFTLSDWQNISTLILPSKGQSCEGLGTRNHNPGSVAIPINTHDPEI